MKKLILLALLNACFDNKTVPKNNRDNERKSNEERGKVADISTTAKKPSEEEAKIADILTTEKNSNQEDKVSDSSNDEKKLKEEKGKVIDVSTTEKNSNQEDKISNSLADDKKQQVINGEITPVSLEEGKIYTFSATFDNLKELYRYNSEVVQEAEEKIKRYLKSYNENEDKKISFAESFRNLYENPLRKLEYFSEKLDKATSEEDIKELIREHVLFVRLFQFRFYCFRIVDNNFEVYHLGHDGNFKWFQMPGLKDNKNWSTSLTPEGSEEFPEKVKDGIYYVHDKPFQIIEVKDLNEITNMLLHIIRRKNEEENQHFQNIDNQELSSVENEDNV